MVNRAFTLIELLVVIAIIAVIAGLLLTGIEAARRAGQRTRTAGIIAVAQAALARAGLERGGGAAAIEHPLAGSRAPRPDFLRAGGEAVASDGEALRPAGALATLPPAWRPRALLPDDRFVGGTGLRLPLLYGAERRQCLVLGAASGRDTRIRLVPAPNARTDRDDDGVVDADCLPMLDDTRYLTAPAIPADPVAAGRTALISLLGSDAIGDLDRLKAIAATPASAGAPALGGRIVAGATLPAWRPGACDAGAGWQTYRLDGTWLVDAWGRELLAVAGDGGAALLSAGRDGVLRWDPGADGAYATAATDAAAAGDDRDGAADNLMAQSETRR